MAKMKKNDLRRIARSVEHYENVPNSAKHYNYKGGVAGANGFWARLGENTGWKYDWEKVEWNEGSNVWGLPSPLTASGTVADDDYAIEYNKCEDFPEGLIVWLEKTPGQSFYTFQCDEFFEGRATTTTQASNVNVELKLKSSYTGKIVSVSNAGGYQCTANAWVMVQRLRGSWILNASRC